MRLREAVASALHLLVILSYSVLGCLALMIPSRLHWRLTAIAWLEAKPEIFYLIGAAFGAGGLFFLFGFFGISRGRFLRIAMRPQPALVHVKLLEQTIDEWFKAHFPDHVRGIHVVLSSSKQLEVGIDLESLEEMKQLQLFKEAEQGLGKLLRERFGYSQPFTLAVHSK